jgi:hypothetical protein
VILAIKAPTVISLEELFDLKAINAIQGVIKSS